MTFDPGQAACYSFPFFFFSHPRPSSARPSPRHSSSLPTYRRVSIDFLLYTPPSSSPPLMSCKFSIRNRAPGISNEMLVFSVSSGRKSRNAWNQWKDQIIMRGNYFCKSMNLNNTQAKLKLQVFKGYLLYYKRDSKNFYFIFHDQNPRVKNFNLGKIVRII